MISKQRIDTALSGEQPDRIPIFELYINASSIVKLAKLMSSEPVEAVGEESGIGDEPFQILDLYCFIIKTLGKGGGYVLSTVHNIQEQVPPENIVAMFEACLSNRN